MTKKRFVVKSSWSLGIESSWEDDKGVERPFWYVVDNHHEQRIVDCIEADEKPFVLKSANRLNEQYIKGVLNETQLFNE